MAHPPLVQLAQICRRAPLILVPVAVVVVARVPVPMVPVPIVVVVVVEAAAKPITTALRTKPIAAEPIAAEPAALPRVVPEPALVVAAVTVRVAPALLALPLALSSFRGGAPWREKRKHTPPPVFVICGHRIDLTP